MEGNKEKNREQKIRNILFIGNGYDLHNGLKTGYTDYLDYWKKNNALSFNNIKIHKSFQELINSLKNLIIIENDPNNELRDSIFIKFKSIKESNSYEDFNEWVGRFIDLKNYTFDHPINRYKYIIIDVNNIKYVILLLISVIIKDEKSYLKENNLRYCDNENSVINTISDKVWDQITNFIELNHIKDGDDLNKILETINTDHKVDSVFSIYLELLRTSSISKNENVPELIAGENWIDIENILYEQQFSCFRSVLKSSGRIEEDRLFKELRYQHFVERYSNKKSLIDDFNCFKKEFAKYIEKEQKKINKDKVKNFLDNLDEKFDIHKMFNFNYSNYINEYLNDHIHSYQEIRNIHGDVSSKENIVFGTNHYMYLHDLEEHNNLLSNQKMNLNFVRKDEENYKLTKMYQLMRLDHTNELTTLNEVTSLTLLGHSIGNQDYEYVHSIINTNPKKIVLNIIWSDWIYRLDDKENEKTTIVKSDNREALADALYDMLAKYEALYGNLSFHKMILENRIRFYNINSFYSEVVLKQNRLLNLSEMLDGNLVTKYEVKLVAFLEGEDKTLDLPLR